MDALKFQVQNKNEIQVLDFVNESPLYMCPYYKTIIVTIFTLLDRYVMLFVNFLLFIFDEYVKMKCFKIDFNDRNGHDPYHMNFKKLS